MMGAVLGLAARQPRRSGVVAGDFAQTLSRAVVSRYIAGVGPAPAGLRGLAARASRQELDAALERLDDHRAALVRGLFPESAAGRARRALIGRAEPFSGPRYAGLTPEEISRANRERVERLIATNLGIAGHVFHTAAGVTPEAAESLARALDPNAATAAYVRGVINSIRKDPKW